jgi:hypothetical protein
MAFAVNYNQLLNDAKALVETEQAAWPSKFKKVFRNARQIDFHTANMPLLDFRLSGGQPEVLAGNNYHLSVVLEFEIATTDLSLRVDAATIVLDLLSRLQALFVANQHFSSVVDSVQLGPFSLVESEDPERDGVFVASSVGQIIVKFYAQ